MEIPQPLQAAGPIRPITCVEMHTAGEPTRIIWNGIPPMTGTLLEQRAQAKAQFDEFRRVLMLEPRGHYDMYGAILRPLMPASSKTDPTNPERPLYARVTREL